MPDAGRTLAGRRIVLVHDWLTGMRGGEWVLEALCRIVPDADLLTLVHVPRSVSPLIERRRIRRSPVDRLPGSGRWYRHYLPLFPAAIELFDLDDADVVISTSHCAAKSVVPTGRAVHVCYCHSPMRYAWDQFDAYFGPERLGATARAAVRPVLAWLARWDRDTAGRVDRFIANSRHVADRIARYYNREASVLHPPVDTDFFTPGGPTPAGRFLVVSALVPYKHIDRAIDAANRLRVPLTVVGGGPERARLEALAGPTVQFAGVLDREALREAYRGAAAVLLPGEEDFGIVPVEAMACGRPVIALGRGGARETVVPGLSGLLFDAPTAAALTEAMRAFRPDDYDPAALRRHAEGFGVARFEAAFTGMIAESLDGRRPC